MSSHPTFEILQEIGQGATATVYRARDLALKRFVAIKELRETLRQDPGRMNQFALSAQFLAEIEHDNLVQVHGLDKDRGWLIMELMRGGLDAKLVEGPLPPELVRSVLRQALGALQCLHDQKRLHGAVKPSNLLINDQGRIKLSDATGASVGGEIRRPSGVPKYHAPELFNPDFGVVGPASDLFSLGLTALELMVGPRFDELFPGIADATDPRLAWMRWHSSPTERIAPVREIVRNIPADLAGVLDRLLIKETTGRLGSAMEALADLDKKPLLLIEPAKTPAISAVEPQSKTAITSDTGPNVVRVDRSVTGAIADSRPERPMVPPRAYDASTRQAGPTRPIKPTTSARPWSSDWINFHLKQPRVFYPVLAAIIMPTIALAALMSGALTPKPISKRSTTAQKSVKAKDSRPPELTRPDTSKLAKSSVPTKSEPVLPPESKSPVEAATYTILSDPPGASLTIDHQDETAQLAPVRLPLQLGKHHAHAELAGYDPLDQEFEISVAGATSPDIRLVMTKKTTDPVLGSVTREPLAPTLQNSVGMDFVLVPAGEFVMGSLDAEGSANEHPQHSVQITQAFYLGTTEVTQGQYKAVTGESPSRFKVRPGLDQATADRLPVESVSYDQAVAFCAGLARLENLPADAYRLPTESEWEYAARGVKAMEQGESKSTDILEATAWYLDNSKGQTHPVGQKQPTSFGLFDMGGNVWEWTSDWYAENAYAKAERTDPQGPGKPTENAFKVLRGGGWIAKAGLCRPTDRNAASPDEGANCYGFRVVRVVPPEDLARLGLGTPEQKPQP